MFIVCVSVQLLKYNLIVPVGLLASTCLNHTSPPFGRYGPSHVWAPLFKNSGSAPEE